MPPSSDGPAAGAKKWFKEFLGTPSGANQGRAAAQPQLQAAAGGYLDRLAHTRDPWAAILDERQGHNDRLHVGAVSGGNWSMSAPRRNLLILGPPRSEKTSSVVVPSILTAPGPTVVVSTRRDVFRATALVRSRLGRVFHYSPDGSPTPPGAVELRWSPITAAVDWATAVEMSLAMTSVGDTASGVTDSSYWRQKASTLLAPLLHAAALQNKDMRWIMRAVRAQDRTTLDEAEEILGSSLGFDAESAYNDLIGITGSDARHRDSIFSTAATALDVYRLGKAVATTANPNFNAHDFVAGQPTAWNLDRWDAFAVGLAKRGVMPPSGDQPLGIYDTIYITCSSERQEMVAPLVVGLLVEIRKAAYLLHEDDEDDGYHDRPPVTFVLDELYGMAPLKDLPKMLASCAGNNVFVVGVLHDLGQARDKWEKAGDSFPTVFGTVAAFPRIADTPTLELLSKLSGETWTEVYSTSVNSNTGRGGSSSGSSETLTPTKLPRLDVGMVHFGNKHAPGQMLVYGLEDSFLTEPSYRYIYPTPYFNAPPWPQLLVATMRHFVETRRLDQRVRLPIPDLDRDGSGRLLRRIGGDDLVEEYQTLKAQLLERADEALKLKEHRDSLPFLAGYEGALGSEVGLNPIEVGIHIPVRVHQAELARLMREWGAVLIEQEHGRQVWSLDDVAYTLPIAPKDSPAHLVPGQWGDVVGFLGTDPEMVFLIEARSREGVHAAQVLADCLGRTFGSVSTWCADDESWGPGVIEREATGEYTPPANDDQAAEDDDQAAVDTDRADEEGEPLS